MTEHECREMIASCAAYWPHQPMPEVSVLGWMDLLGAHPAGLVRDAIRDHAASGEKFPPTPGQIANTILAASRSMPEWGSVLEEIRQMMRMLNRTGRTDSVPRFQFHSPSPDEWSSPLVAKFIERSGGINNWREELASWFPGGTDNTTFLAQQRGVWNGMAARAERDDRLTAIEAHNLKTLESGPQTIGEIVSATIEAQASEPRDPQTRRAA